FTLHDYPTSQRPGLRLWIASMGLQPVAWVLYGLRGQIPDLYSIVVANAALSLSYALQLHSLRRFVGRADRLALVYAPVPLVAASEILFTFVYPSPRMRLVSVSLLIAVSFFMSVTALLRGGGPRRRSNLLTAISLLFPALVLVVRSVYEGLRHDALTSPFTVTPMQAAVFGMASFLPIVATLGFVSMCNDRLNQELVRQAMLDPLTGISNRRALDESAADAIAVARRHDRDLAVLLVDADHFKQINDRYGHGAGDAALQALVAMLQASLRPGDLLGRLGGEEFAVVLPDSDEAGAFRAAERLRNEVAATQFAIQREPVPLRVSIGIALLEGDDDLVTMLRRADQAMYVAKRSGRNRVVGPRQMRQPAAAGNIVAG
ncbi:MAG TPA: GGDEF domain-containing protein, partial [Xanthomonadaceae bacterium]|nr:GGDEF domain-containing protein [Xanthomonadaceae bacterium]